MSTQEERKAWRGVGQKYLDGGFLSVVELNTLTHAVVELVDEIEQSEDRYVILARAQSGDFKRLVELGDKLASREKALREVQERLRGIAGHWYTDENKLIQIGILIEAELGE